MPHLMTFDAYLDGRLLAHDLLPTTVEDLSKLEISDLSWAVEEHGVCSVLDNSGRRLDFVARGDDLPKDQP